MISIVSQAWTTDADGAAQAYVQGWEDFTPLLRSQPGFRGRILLRDTEDGTHFTNVRFFDRAEDYDELIHRDGYRERIEALAEFLNLETPPTKQVADCVLMDMEDGVLMSGDDGGSTGAGRRRP